jgi:hypothetical protein
MLHRWIKSGRRTLWLSGLALLALLCAACGAGTMSAASNTSSGSMSAPAQYAAVHSAAGTGYNGASASAASTARMPDKSGSSAQPAASTPQYLIKTLKVSMNVKNTTKVADDLQSWISQTDPLSSSAGTDYEQAGNNLYSISMTFSVEAKFYPLVYDYLRDYAGQHGGQLTAFNESVQDVTNDYVDTTSRLRNLRAEQSRLLDLMAHAQAMGDILSIDQRLTDIEGQIEDIEGHLNSLKSQVAFYTVEISLQPIEVAPPPPPPTGWSIGQAFHDAFAASLAFGQGLITFIIWLLAFAVYLIPIALIGWLVLRLRGRVRRVFPPPASVK